MKCLVILLSVLFLTSCQWQPNRNETNVYSELENYKRSLPIIVANEYVLTASDYEYAYNQPISEVIELSPLEHVNELNDYFDYMLHANLAMNELIEMTLDSGVLSEHLTQNNETDLLSSNEANSMVLNTSVQTFKLTNTALNDIDRYGPRVSKLDCFIALTYELTEIGNNDQELVFDTYIEDFTESIRLYAYYFDRLNHTDIDNQVTLMQSYFEVRSTFITLLTCYLNEVYLIFFDHMESTIPSLETPITPTRDEIEQNLYNYIAMSIHLIEDGQSYVHFIDDFLSLLHVIEEFHLIVALTNQTGIIDRDLASEGTLSSDYFLQADSALQLKLNEINQTNLNLDTYLFNKLVVTNELMIDYYQSFFVDQPTQIDDSLELYYTLYGLVNSLIRQLETDSLFE